VDLGLEAVGITAYVHSAIDCVRKGGAVTLIGNISPEVTLPLPKVARARYVMQGSCASGGRVSTGDRGL